MNQAVMPFFVSIAISMLPNWIVFKYRWPRVQPAAGSLQGKKWQKIYDGTAAWVWRRGVVGAVPVVSNQVCTVGSCVLVGPKLFSSLSVFLSLSSASHKPPQPCWTESQAMNQTVRIKLIHSQTDILGLGQTRGKLWRTLYVAHWDF